MSRRTTGKEQEEAKERERTGNTPKWESIIPAVGSIQTHANTKSFPFSLRKQ